MKTSKLVKSQYKIFTADSNAIDKAVVTVDGADYRKVVMEIRFDDRCGNGHNTFSITGSAWCVGSRIKRDDPDTCGCIHEILTEAFPDQAHLIKYHLMSSDSPLHYVANTLYHARTCSHQDKKPDDPVKFKRVVLLGNSQWPLNFSSSFMDYIETAQKCGFKLSIKEVEHKDNKKGGYQFDPKYTLDGFDCEWYQCPFDNKEEAIGFIETYHNHGCTIKKITTEFAKEVTPDIDAARLSAIWPEATLEQLQDKGLLESRLPNLVNELANAVESLGMEF